MNPAGDIVRSQELRDGDLGNTGFPRLGLAPFPDRILMVTTTTAEPEPQIVADDSRDAEDAERGLIADIAAPPGTAAARSDEVRVLVSRPSHA